MGKLSRFRRDSSVATSGRWVSFREGIRLLIASDTQRGWLDVFTAEIEKSQAVKKNGERRYVDDVLLTCHRQMARFLLKGWENIEDEAGNPVPYSEAKAIEYLSDPDALVLREFVHDESRKIDAFLVASREADAGN